jgi:hypothetical protein
MATPSEQDAEHLKRQELRIKWFQDHLRRYMSQKFYGRITLIMEGGDIRRINEERSVIPP